MYSVANTLDKERNDVTDIVEGKAIGQDTLTLKT